MRTDGDDWDIVTSVGATALLVATLRSLGAAEPDPLVQDDFARLFVEAAGDTFFSRALTDPTLTAGSSFPIDHMSLRTKHFDEFFLSAAAEGIGQAVIVAAGLDARALRLPWPPGAVVFEIDQPRVLEFKDRVLAAHEIESGPQRQVVAVDLRDDWPSRLCAAGFDAARATAWSCEGLLGYLPGAAQDALFERIHALSAPGSRLAVDTFVSGLDIERVVRVEGRGINKDLMGGIDVTELFYTDERSDPTRWLESHGWTVRSTLPGELSNAYGKTIPRAASGEANMSDWTEYLTAIK
ncbi:class I SAM-dependent methyltransferase [Nocardia sp. NPDC058519]|uniref:class I SAM-dependent methyltransferase n=1 Tax=unclassified Nocardia TaxID=2637762 RepID=UPI003646F6F8